MDENDLKDVPSELKDVIVVQLETEEVKWKRLIHERLYGKETDEE